MLLETNKKIFAKTLSGSIYEIDDINKKIRRLSGLRIATPYIGEDNEWRNYLNITLTIDKSLSIIWKIDSVNDKSIMRTTLTSPVIKYAYSLDELFDN